MKIFISYRREDTAAHVGRLFEHLQKEFGRSSVFMDIDTIEPGQPFAERITTSVRSAAVVLVAIGGRWLDVIDAEGRRRIDNPDDFVRLEVETALSSNLRVIPVLFGGATPPQANALPSSLRPLATLQATEISDARFPYDSKRLSRSIYKGFGRQDRLRSFAIRRPVLMGGLLLVVCLLAGAIVIRWTESTPGAADRPSAQPAGLGGLLGSSNDVPRTPAATGEAVSRALERGSSPALDVAIMKLKREIDRRGQIFDLMRTGVPLGSIGINVAQVSPDTPVYISSVIPTGPGVKAGLAAGDVLIAIDGLPVEAPNQVIFDVLKFSVGTTHMVAVRRGSRELAFPIAVEAMGRADIDELNALIEDRSRAMSRQFPELADPPSNRPDRQRR